MLRRSVLVLGLLMALAGTVGAADKEEPKAESYSKVESKGKLQTGVMAIGGETTGIMITTKDGTLELDLGKNKELRAEAEKLNGKAVHVTGTLSVRKGVEIRQRLIVTVATLKAAEAKEK